MRICTTRWARERSGRMGAGPGTLSSTASTTERLLDLLLDLSRARIPGAYTLYSTPSYAIRLHALAEGRGMDLKDLNVRKGIFSGEPGLQIPGYRAKIEEAWGMVAMDLYGAAERSTSRLSRRSTAFA